MEVDIKSWLESFGADEKMIMYLSGQAGSGKSYVLKACIKVVENLYQALGLSFGQDVFQVTALTGAAASNFPGGVTTHSAAKLNSKLSRLKCDANFAMTQIFVVDEVSFMGGAKDLRNLDKRFLNHFF